MTDKTKLIKEFPWLGNLQGVAATIVETLFQKEKSYRGSWLKRGGQGAFMMLARKWDRIEGQSQAVEYDIFKATSPAYGDEGMIDDIDDLIGYLLLVRAEMQRRADEEESRVQGFKAGARISEGQLAPELTSEPLGAGKTYSVEARYPGIRAPDITPRPNIFRDGGDVV